MRVIICKLISDKLTGARWDLGTCIPDPVFSALQKSQIELQDVKVTTDLQCGTNRFTKYSLALGIFKSLRTLSWTGINGPWQMVDLREGLESNARKLESLSIDLVNARYLEELQFNLLHADGGDDTERFNFTVQCFTKGSSGDKALRLSTLQALSLTEVPFAEDLKDVCAVLSLSNLTSLKLVRCPGGVDLINELVSLHVPLKLTSFELTIDPDSDVEEEPMGFTRDISQFLGSFHGLVDLSLLLPMPIEWKEIFGSISHHQSSLKRLVVHALDDGDGDGFIDTPIDEYTPKEFLESCNLEFLGTASTGDFPVRPLF